MDSPVAPMTGRLANDDGDPLLTTDRLALAPIAQRDYDALRNTELSEELILTWRHRGSTPGPEDYGQGLWAGVLSQFFVVSLEKDQPVGIIACYGADFRNGHAFLAGTKFAPRERSTLFMEGVILFVDFVFYSWPFRKLYLDVPEYNMGQLRSLTRKFFVEEGRLVAHLAFGDRFWDQHILALHRQTWREQGATLLRFVRRPG